MYPTPVDSNAYDFNVSIDVISGEVTRCGTPISLGARERAIVMALAIEPRGLSRERLADMAYTDSQCFGAADAVKVHIHRLRRRMGVNFIVNVERKYVFGSSVRISRPTRMTDALDPQAVRRMNARELEEMRLLARKLRLPIPSELEYLDWYSAFSANYKRIGREIALGLSREMAARGLHVEAIQIASELTFEDQCDEEAWEQVIRAQLSLGQRSAALHGYRFLRVALEKDLGVEPSSSLSALLSV